MLPSLARRVFSEWLGTAFLLATVVGSGIMAQGLSGGNGALALLCNTLPTGAILVVLILVFEPLSGAHFNPLVSLAFALRRELPWLIAAGYVGAQIAGAIVGVWAAHIMFELPVWQFATTPRAGMGPWVAEAIATFGLLLTILGCTIRRPTTVGLYITAAYWFTASTSFANPAVTIARSLTDTFAGIAPSGVAAFVAAQIVGAAFAMLVGGWLWIGSRSPSSPPLSSKRAGRSKAACAGDVRPQALVHCKRHRLSGISCPIQTAPREAERTRRACGIRNP